jgi:hypothetical protein
MLDAISAGPLEADGTTTVWHTTRVVAAHDPVWTVELLEALMAQLLMRPEETVVDSAFQASEPWSARRGFGGEEAIATAAREVPEDFADRLSPLAVELMRRHARGRHGRSGPAFDEVWGVRHSQPDLLTSRISFWGERFSSYWPGHSDTNDRVHPSPLRPCIVLTIMVGSGLDQPRRPAVDPALWALVHKPSTHSLRTVWRGDHGTLRRLALDIQFPYALGPSCRPGVSPRPTGIRTRQCRSSDLGLRASHRQLHVGHVVDCEAHGFSHV